MLGIVLVGLIVLAIVSAVAISIGWRTVHMEAWQTQNLERRRLDAVARSAANILAETISDDAGAGLTSFGASVTDGTTPVVTTINAPLKTYLAMSLEGTDKNNYTITSVASADSGQIVTVTLARSNSSGTVTTTWGKGK